MTLEKKKIKFIAEISSNHNQSLDRCLELIDNCSRVGFYAVKFQLFKINQLFSKEILSKSRTHRARKEWELPEHFIPEIAKFCKKKKIKFGCTPFYLDAVNILDSYVDFFKISSYEILWHELIHECMKRNKKIICSTGMASITEISSLVKLFNSNKYKNFSLLYCISEYPTSLESCNLNSINYLRNKFNCKVGLSDHSRNPLIVYESINTYKAEEIEMHVDLNDKRGAEFEGNHCWTIEESEQLIKFNNNLKKIRGRYTKSFSKLESTERLWRADPTDGLRPFKQLRSKFK